jgi:hypothetical protein
VCVYIEEWCGKAVACTTRGALCDGRDRAKKTIARDSVRQTDLGGFR